jgi:hypothetical protein
LLFDLRSNFVCKVGGKQRNRDYFEDNEKTMFLCADYKIVEKLFEIFPKSKIVL